MPPPSSCSRLPPAWRVAQAAAVAATLTLGACRAPEKERPTALRQEGTLVTKLDNVAQVEASQWPDKVWVALSDDKGLLLLDLTRKVGTPLFAERRLSFVTDVGGASVWVSVADPKIHDDDGIYWVSSDGVGTSVRKMDRSANGQLVACGIDKCVWRVIGNSICRMKAESDHCESAAALPPEWEDPRVFSTPNTGAAWVSAFERILSPTSRNRFLADREWRLAYIAESLEVVTAEKKLAKERFIRLGWIGADLDRCSLGDLFPSDSCILPIGQTDRAWLVGMDGDPGIGVMARRDATIAFEPWHSSRVTFLGASRDGRHLWVGQGDEDIVMFDAESETKAKHFKFEPMRLTGFVPNPEGSTAWVAAVDQRPNRSRASLDSSVRVYALGPNGTSPPFPTKDQVWLTGLAADATHAWFSRRPAAGFDVFDEKAISLASGLPSLALDDVLVAKTFAADPMAPATSRADAQAPIGACLRSDAGWFAVRFVGGSSPETSQAVGLTIGGMPVEVGKPSRLAVDPTQAPSVAFELSQKEPSSPGPRARRRLEVSLLDGNDAVASGSRSLTGATSDSVTLSFHAGVDRKWNHPYSLRAMWEDEQGTRLTSTWSDILFVKPWMDRAPFRSLLVALAIVAMALAMRALVGRTRGVGPWVPTAAYLLGPTLGGIDAIADSLKIDARFLVAYLFLFAVLGLLSGAFSPRGFRLLAGVAPFHVVAPLVLAWSPVRRRLYSDYVRLTRARLGQEREDQRNEAFVELEATVRSAALPAPRVLGAPVTAVVDALGRVGPAGATYAYIVGPGGRGKSALLRAIVDRLLDRFSKFGVGPLPILMRGGSTDLTKAIEAELGRFALAPQSLTLQLERGDFVLIFDGLSEGGWDAAALSAFANSDAGEATPVLATLRPDARILQCVQVPERWLEVRPEPLHPLNLDRFVAEYSLELAKRGHPVAPLSNELRRVCRDPAGNYSPILVRLSLSIGSKGITGIADLYVTVFESLTGGAPDLLSSATTLSGRWFWKERKRSIPYRENDQEKPILNRLGNHGLMLGVDAPMPTSKGERQPKRARFFHDSFMSFLAARSLALDPKGYKDVLLAAAGDPHFCYSDSEVAQSGVSELFVMCREVFHPEDFARCVSEELSAWSSAHVGDLTVSAVLQAAPEAFRRSAIRQAETSAGRALESAIQSCRGNPDTLAELYGRLAPQIWAARQRAASAAGTSAVHRSSAPEAAGTHVPAPAES